MTSAEFMHCPDCGRLMLGNGPHPQPHDCPGESESRTPPASTGGGDRG